MSEYPKIKRFFACTPDEGDSEVIKALKCCSKNSHEVCALECPIFKTAGCVEKLHEAALDLINRQKAEIEELKLNIVKEALNESCRMGGECNDKP